MKRLFFAMVFSVICLTVGAAGNSYALSGSDFNAGNIISDSVFYNSNTMTAEDIQNFLNAKMTSCDTWGTKKYNGGPQTRAEYGASKGYPAPYTCLKDYEANTPSMQQDNYCAAYTGGVKKASAMIHDVAKSCGINPQVLLVLLQKEQSFITDDWPWPSQYNKATGYSCSDSAPCNPEFAGFFYQVYYAARQYRRYQALPQNYSYRAGRNNEISYQANKPECGTKIVFIENQATAGLYNYTPYTPNEKALENLYGAGDGCSAYGNRNFWRIFNEWFGSTHLPLEECDSKLNNVTCVWELKSPENFSFYTASIEERNSLVKRHSGWEYYGLAFYAYSTDSDNTTPVYRLNNISGTQGRHFWTPNKNERDYLVSEGAIDEGIAWYSKGGNPSNTAYPIFRLLGGDGHVLTKSPKNKDYLLAHGYTLEDNTNFFAPSNLVDEASPSVGKINIYRLYKDEHFYTTSLQERDSLIKEGWVYEKVLTETSATQTVTPVYRLNGAEHFYTTNIDERNYLIRHGWKDEGIGWYTDDSTQEVYRVNGSEHFYTADVNELMELAKSNWLYEGVSFGSNALKTPVLRLNELEHFYTANIKEAFGLVKSGWDYEGIAFYASTDNTTTPTYRLYNGFNHFYTKNENEKNHAVANGYRFEGVAFYTLTANTTPVYRLYQKEHFYTANQAERDYLIGHGWGDEGIGWYGG